MFMNLPLGLNDAPHLKGNFLWLKWSLYGHRYAAKLFYELLRKILVEKLHFQVSPHDHCLFIHHDCLIVTWVNDMILITKTPGVADEIIKAIRSHDLDLDKRNKGGLAEYLGINIRQLPDGSTELTQSGLIGRIIESLGLEAANGKFTPVTETLARYKDHPTFNGRFNYQSVVGMILYLANTTRPDISFAINQCARFSSNPKEPHASALKRIGCYLK